MTVIIDFLVDFLWLSTDWLGLGFSKMSRRRMIVAIALWSISDLMFIAAGLLFLFKQVALFDESALNVVSGFLLFFYGLIQFVYVGLKARMAICKSKR